MLLVEDSLDYAALLRAALTRAKLGSFELAHVQRLDAALLLLEKETFDVLLLDLSSPEGDAVFTIGCGCALANHLPIIVLTGTDDDDLGMKALRAGAQDYLVKSRIDRRVLPRTILHAVERHRRMARLCALRGREAG